MAMFNATITQQLQQTTTRFLKDIINIDYTVIDQLREVLVFHEYRYYILNDPLISDFEYDQLYKALERIEASQPHLISATSPTQRVAKGITKTFETVPHLVPMLSLENSYNAEDLKDWDKKVKELSTLDAVTYCIEPKFDGASISLLYENDTLIRAVTRGDGVAGDDITTNIKQLYAVPLSATFSTYGLQQVEIRGEVLMSKKSFKQYNQQLVDQNMAPLANPRNAAAGALRMKDPAEVRRRKLEAFLYHISFYNFIPSNSVADPLLHTHQGNLEMLWNLGFRSPVKEKKVAVGIEAAIDHCQWFEKERDNLPYEIDGMVIKVNDIELQEKLGATTHHPRWAMAYKFKARQATSQLITVEFQVGRTGSVTPVGKIMPVAIGGVTVSSMSLFNEAFIKEKQLMVGDAVLVERAGDVIPYIVKSLPELRKGTETPIVFPTHCPVCNTHLIKPIEEAVWRCQNFNCAAQVVERIIHFVSKDAMDIRSLGEANIKKFFELGLLKDIPGIYHLNFEAIGQLEGFGLKSVDNLRAAIDKSKTQPLYRVVFGLGIRYVGETTAKILAHTIDYLPNFKNYTLEMLQDLEDVGPKVASSIVDFFNDANGLSLLSALEQSGIDLHSKKMQPTHSATNLQAQTFLFTGTLVQLKRTEAEAMVEAQGGKLLGSVSSNLNYLVVGEAAGSKLEKAKKIPSIKIITETEFLKLVDKKIS
jgi:DNA ligase (NAD+)